jgi:hypothetical protein
MKEVKTDSGQPIRFVPPGAKDAYYEIKVFETGRVETRPDSLHDFFNALAWLAFPRTKARINALHAAEIRGKGPAAARCATCSQSLTKAAPSCTARTRP